MQYVLHVILIGLATTCIAKSEGSVSYSNRTVSYPNRTVSYPNRTVVMMGISGTMNRISIDDTAHDNRTDLIVVGPSSFGSIRRGVTDNNIMVSAYIDYSETIRGAEAIDFLKENNAMRSMVVACSRNNLRYGGNKSPAGAIQIVREKFGAKNNNDPITVTTLIPSKNLQGPTVLMTEVNGRDVKAIDMNKDGYIDIVATVSGKSSNGQSVGFLLYFQNDGKDKFSTIVVSESLNGKAVLDVGDCDQNGFLDIAVLGIDSSDLNVFYQEDDNTFTPKLIGTL
jgi:FG-GAP-like repeat